MEDLTHDELLALHALEVRYTYRSLVCLTGAVLLILGGLWL